MPHIMTLRASYALDMYSKWFIIADHDMGPHLCSPLCLILVLVDPIVFFIFCFIWGNKVFLKI